MEIEIGSYLGKVTEGRLSNESKEHIRSIYVKFQKLKVSPTLVAKLVAI